MLRLLDLFSGIGMYSLGLQRAGLCRPVAFCEREHWCWENALKPNWPGVPIYDDVRTLTAQALASAGIWVDAICGGFPCQDISSSGRGAGIDGTRSGLWREYRRLVCELRPRYVFVENTSALLVRGLDRVLGDLASIGYDAEWHCIQAADVGAPHLRDRTWIVAYPAQPGGRPGFREARSRGEGPEREHQPVPGDGGRHVGHAHGHRQQQPGRDQPESRRRTGDTGPRLRTLGHHLARLRGKDWADWQPVTGADNTTRLIKPGVALLVHGGAGRVDQEAAWGNSIVPQIPEAIGRAVMDWEGGCDCQRPPTHCSEDCPIHGWDDGPFSIEPATA